MTKTVKIRQGWQGEIYVDKHGTAWGAWVVDATGTVIYRNLGQVKELSEHVKQLWGWYSKLEKRKVTKL